MNKIEIVLVCGRRYAGKTTIARYLENQYGYCRIRFADRLKRMLVSGLGIDPRYIDGDRKEEACPELCGKTARHGMVTLGTEWGRELIDPGIWVSALSRDLDRLIESGRRKFVIDDLRFLTEEAWANDYLRKFANVWIIKVVKEKEELTWWQKVLSWFKKEHQSEAEIKYIKEDSLILNNESLKELYSKLDTMFGTAE